jgi:hypothetical protein
MPALELLDLDKNALGSRGIRSFARALLHPAPKDQVPSTEEGQTVPCARLRVLSLASNGIGTGGATELAAALVPSSYSSSYHCGAPSPCQMYVIKLVGLVYVII